MVSKEESARRLKAARELRGMASSEELAAFLKQKGYSPRTLANLEAGRSAMTEPQVTFLSKRLGLSESFFTADGVERLGDLIDTEATPGVTPDDVVAWEPWRAIQAEARRERTEAKRAARLAASADETDAQLAEARKTLPQKTTPAKPKRERKRHA